MEDWYCQQEFFDQIQFEKIQSWMSYEIIDIFDYGNSELQSEFAV